jgi:hypothetical protein
MAPGGPPKSTAIEIQRTTEESVIISSKDESVVVYTCESSNLATSFCNSQPETGYLEGERPILAVNHE